MAPGPAPVAAPSGALVRLSTANAFLPALSGISTEISLLVKPAFLRVSTIRSACVELFTARKAVEQAGQSALHFRRRWRLSVATAGTIEAEEKSETPCGDRGFGVGRRHLAKAGKMEAAGTLMPLENHSIFKAFGILVIEKSDHNSDEGDYCQFVKAIRHLASPSSCIG